MAQKRRRKASSKRKKIVIFQKLISIIKTERDKMGPYWSYRPICGR